jgi:cytochrome c oxidase subunit 2
MKIRSIVLSTFLFLMIAASYVMKPTTAQSGPKKIEVVAKRFAYEPAEITLKKGEPVVIVLKSTDVAHGIHFKELNLQAKIDKGGSGELAFTPDKTGDYVGHCSVFCGSGHGSMTLTFHVVE